MKVYVFSYNRGEFLDNCLGSIDRCLPEHEVHVIDDNSQDLLTCEVLERWSDRFRIHRTADSDGDYKVGGLNQNMQWALDDAVDAKTEFALFIQDDMQMLRPLERQDRQAIQEFFRVNESATQYVPCFMKLANARDETERTVIDPSNNAYIRQPGHSRQRAFIDVGVFHAHRFQELFGPLQGGEGSNNEEAERRGLIMGLAIRPFMMWLPMPISHRGKSRGPILKAQERLAGAGFHPYTQLDQSATRALFTTHNSLRPFAEKWLTCEGVKGKRQWSFVGGRSSLEEQGGWRRAIARLMKVQKDLNRAIQRRLDRTLATRSDTR
ncbi:glycosyltransferase family A protein [Wenzhouxiangella sp. EGI_FJ10409]|uniref:glycosyltransferase family A protein n=1 Tax=Wenzhouxiangella sp. EGI_FJ10409 TaxID=3243767 RepID=UPI0035D981B5